MNRKARSFVLKALVPAIVLGFASAAHAKQPKVSILHCGVDEDSQTMVYHEISVSSSSKGHAKHGPIESVGTGEFDADGNEIFVDYVRFSADCVLGEDSAPGLSACVFPEAGDACGMLQADMLPAI
jgi:hypothetical protein